MAYTGWRNRFVQFFVCALALGVAFGIGRCTGGGSAAPGGSPPAVADATPTVWTCSMHPNIRLPDPVPCPICFMDLIPVQTGDADASAARLSLSERARVLARVDTTLVQRRALTHEIRMVGKVAADETRITYISSYVPGRIDRLFVDFTGMMVRKGDHLAELYSPELLVAQREYLLARRGVQQAESSGASQMAVQSAQSMLEAARRKLELWGIPHDEIERLGRTGEASDHMRIDAPSAGWVLERQGFSGMYVETGTRLFTMVDLTRVWVLLDAYESDVQYLRYGQPVEFESESFAGEKFIGKIAFIDPVLNEATRTVKVRVNVPNQDVRLRPGMFIGARVQAQLGEGGVVLSNELAGRYICPMHPEVMDNAVTACTECGMDLVPAESLGYATSDAPAEEVLAIPTTSVLLTGRRAIAYVELPPVESDEPDAEPAAPVFEGRVVELGPRAGDWYVVLSGLTEGERVVTRGALQIDSAMQVQGKPSMMTPGVTMNGADAEKSADDEMAKIVSRAIEGAAYHQAARPMIDGYLKLTAMLAADDEDKSRAAAADLRNAATAAAEKATEVGLSAENAEEFARLMKAIAEASSFEPKTDIEHIRMELPTLNRAFETYLRTFGHDRATPIHRAYCPMAFDDKGAYWFQSETTIDNAYFGSRMLRCGVIRGAIGPEGKETR